MDDTLSGMIKRYKDGFWSTGSSKQRGYKACNCVGPRDGEPVCACRMENVKIRDGRWIEEIDHGPAPKHRWYK